MVQLRILCVLLSFSIALVTSNESSPHVDPRGVRIVEHKTQSDCKSDVDWPICTDEDWGIKCPSGCRIQGLIDETNYDFQNRIEKIKRALLDNQNSYKSSNSLKQEIFNYLERNLPNEQELNTNYGQISDDLRRRLVTLKQRVANKVERIKTLQNSIQNQVGELKRLEVDIDIKIRACKGSCARVFNYNLDTESYGNIQKQLVQVNAIKLVSEEEEAVPLKSLKITQVKDSTAPSHYKSSSLTDQEANILDSIKVFKVVLEDSKGSIADTKYAAPGTAGKSSTSKAIISPATDFHTSHTCIKTITKKVIRGPDGLREETVEEFKTPDGLDCSDLQDFLKEATSSGGGGSGSRDFVPQHPDANSGSLSFSYTKTQGGDIFSEIGEGEVDDFSTFDHFSHEGNTKTIIETKSRRIVETGGFVEEVQHDEYTEHNTELQEQSLNAEEKPAKGNTGTGIHPVHGK